jgi:hypothetical protein
MAASAGAVLTKEAQKCVMAAAVAVMMLSIKGEIGFHAIDQSNPSLSLGRRRN